MCHISVAVQQDKPLVHTTKFDQNLSMDLRKLASKSFPDISLIALTNAGKSQTCILSNADDHTLSSTMGKFSIGYILHHTYKV